MVNELLSHPEEVDRILEKAVACIVTTKEHSLLEKYKHLYGWDRYRCAGITVIDTSTRQLLAL
jgi:hypothetical protein